MWQFRVKIEHYFIAYFDCITALEADWSYSFPGKLTLTVVGFSPARRSYSLIHVYPRMTPDTENERGIAVVVAVAVPISYYQ